LREKIVDAEDKDIKISLLQALLCLLWKKDLEEHTRQEKWRGEYP